MKCIHGQRESTGSYPEAVINFEANLKSFNYNIIRAVVAELVRVSYLIDTLSMLKVKGSNPGHPETFFVSECRDKNISGWN